MLPSSPLAILQISMRSSSFDWPLSTADQDRGDPEEDRGDPEEEDRGDPEEDIGDQNEEIGDQHEEIGNVAKKKTRGLTRLVKLHKDFRESKGKRRVVEFDQWGRLTGKYRAEFSSYLGDLVRHAVGLRTGSNF
ncbi:hypothetical protein L6452_02258 [Arctium lappa]|uniref:Uncharacterized protein n=1 Tax=Arctium lappa TaxID=4217 RepID=A0ACB9FKF0_ARCLA|nr:hypothetical protein L6452_02258 [Arctium lappa]